MTVKEAKDAIVKLEGLYSNLGKIQDLCLSRDNSPEVRDAIQLIERSANINTNLRTLCSASMEQLNIDIKRINDLIDRTVVPGV